MAIGLAFLLGFTFPRNFDYRTSHGRSRSSGDAGTSPCRLGCATTCFFPWPSRSPGSSTTRRSSVCASTPRRPATQWEPWPPCSSRTLARGSVDLRCLGCLPRDVHGHGADVATPTAQAPASSREWGLHTAGGSFGVGAVSERRTSPPRLGTSRPWWRWAHCAHPPRAVDPLVSGATAGACFSAACSPGRCCRGCWTESISVGLDVPRTSLSSFGHGPRASRAVGGVGCRLRALPGPVGNLDAPSVSVFPVLNMSKPFGIADPSCSQAR